MEIFMTNISIAAKESRIVAEIARVVHGPSFTQFNMESLLNFEVHLHRPKKRRSSPASYRTGTVTFPSEDIGRHFLDVCGNVAPPFLPDLRGGVAPRIPINIGRPITFQFSRNEPKVYVVERIRRLPFRDPKEIREREERRQAIEMARIPLTEVQFGWECRDDVFSVEYSKQVACEVHFSLERRAFEISLGTADAICENITVFFSQIQRVSACDGPGQDTILFTLYYAPRFEYGLPLRLMEDERDLNSFTKRTRLTSLNDSNHRRVSPYVKHALQIVCMPSGHQEFLTSLLSQVNLRIVQDNHHTAFRRIFSPDVLDELRGWVQQLSWPIAYHVDALIYNGVMDPKELLALRSEIDKGMRDLGEEYFAGFLRFYGEQLGVLWFSEGSQSQESSSDCFHRCRKEYKHHALPPADDLFHCLHVSITPSGMVLSGPFPERTNRVIRGYSNYRDHFLRVTFVEEDLLRLRFDSNVDGRAFINSRVGDTLRNGLIIGGRHFEFLHYSQSALKDHAVWFINPFCDSISRTRVDAASIIRSIGTFKDLPFDLRLVYCPARYAARICQAFTTTDSSISIKPEEIVIGKDIKSSTGSCFTDGVGTISAILADEIWNLLCCRKRRGFRSHRPRPRAFQIRFRGSKGMVSVDYTLIGRELVIRPSMIKFEAATNEIEIAGVFNRPGKMYLNRPLIMLLEGLGVSGSTFLELQRRAVENVMKATSAIEETATMLQTYGLGQSYRLTSVLRNLSKLNSHYIPTDSFYARGIQNAIFHILRDFKHRARIPVPGWTLVGIADVHLFLEEGQVFVCIEEEKGVKKFLEGTVSISRSPTIHPGDVQLARAIGRPPYDSPFAQEALSNTIVFSSKGKRSLPSCLGGGDLDGDVYNITDYTDLLPRQACEAASYDPAQRKELDRPSTRDDVIDFIVDYIYADNLGIIATNWLIIADQRSILDPDCLKLAQLHSDAVDYPKSGNSVPMQSVPSVTRLPKPDWMEPEFIASERYYPSERAIGRLYRDIDLSETSLKGILQKSGTEDLADALHALSLAAETDCKIPKMNDSLWRDVGSKVLELTGDLPVSMSEERNLYLNDIFGSYSQQLSCICSSNTLSNKRYARLSEAEAFMGTITARTSQKRKRSDLISKLREQTTQLVADIRFELAGSDNMQKLDRLGMAWDAWQLSMEKMRQGKFGAASFFWIALGSIFAAISSIEGEDVEDD